MRYYLSPFGDLSVSDLRRLYVYLTLIADDVRYDPGTAIFTLEAVPGDFEERMNGDEVRQYVYAYGDTPDMILGL